MKRVVFLGDALSRLREFPEPVRREAGFQLQRVQEGLDPNDWKPMSSVGSGVREIRIRDESGAFRVLYIAAVGDAVYVLHAFQKKSQKTAQRDLDLARTRLGRFEEASMERQSFENVWEALEETPGDAENMAMRSSVLIAIQQRVKEWNVTQTAAARRLGITQPRLNDLLRGRIDRFSLDMLINLAGRSGLVVRLDIGDRAA